MEIFSCLEIICSCWASILRTRILYFLPESFITNTAIIGTSRLIDIIYAPVGNFAFSPKSTQSTCFDEPNILSFGMLTICPSLKALFNKKICDMSSSTGINFILFPPSWWLLFSIIDFASPSKCSALIVFSATNE